MCLSALDFHSPLNIRKDLVTLLALLYTMGHVEGSQVFRFLGLQVTVPS